MKYMHQFTTVFSNVIRLNTDCLRVNRRAVYCVIVITIIAECRRICGVWKKHLVEKYIKKLNATNQNKLDLDYHKPSNTRAETHAGRACVETYTADIVITDTGRSVLYGHGPGAYCSQARMNTYKIDRPKAQSVYNNCGIINHRVMHRVKWRHRIYGHDTIAMLWV